MDSDTSTKTFDISDPETWSPFLTLQQTAEILQVSPWTLRQWDNGEKFVAVRIGPRRDRRYRKDDVIKALKEGI